MLFVSDLDNTLIHSYKYKKEGDICVGIKNKEEVSFMPKKSYSMLRDIVKLCTFVPITTRSLEQYRRLDLGVYPKYALVSHGALLLVDGEIDEGWLVDTYKLIDTKLPKIEENNVIYGIRYIEDFFIFAKSDNPQKALLYLNDIVDCEKLKISAVRNKIYVFPQNLDKGIALKRLKNILSPKKIICAGDSLLDVPMLELADIAIFPKTVNFSHTDSYCFDIELFSSKLLDVVMHRILSDSFGK